MALLKKKYTDIPADAVILNENEALEYQNKILYNWKKSSDVFAYEHGIMILGGASFFTGLWLNNYYRKKFKLFHFGRMASYLPICVLPATFSGLIHFQFVLRDVALQKKGSCPVCLEMRASAFQGFFGTVFPFILGNLSTFSLAQKYGTYDIPYITQQPMKVFKLMQTTAKPISNFLLAIFIGQALLGSVVTYFEAKSVFTVNEKLAQLEYELEHHS